MIKGPSLEDWNMKPAANQGSTIGVHIRPREKTLLVSMPIEARKDGAAGKVSCYYSPNNFRSLVPLYFLKSSL